MIDDFQLTIRIYPIKHYQTINDVTMSCKFLVFFLWPGLVARPLVPSNWGMQCLTWLTTAGFRRDGDLMALGWDIVGFFNHIQQYIYESNGDKKKWKEQIDKYIHNTYIYIVEFLWLWLSGFLIFRSLGETFSAEVDPLEPNRVWFFSRATGTHTGPLMAIAATGAVGKKTWQGWAQ